MIDEKTLQRLLRGEVHRLNAGLADQVPLRHVRSDAGLETPTRDGQPHRFDAAAVAHWWATLSPLCRSGLQVPVRFYIAHDASGTAFLADADAIEAVRQLGLTVGQVRDGKAWLSLPRAQWFARAHPTLVQFVRQ